MIPALPNRFEEAESENVFVDGLKFGLLLQLAVGPMCLLVFNTARASSCLRSS